jgi:segregation and condensation protein B
MTDERPDSLAAQAASWVPPWERAPREPDRAYRAAAEEPDVSDDVDEEQAALDEPDTIDQPDEGDKVDEAGLSGDDDDFDEAFEGPNPPAYEEEASPEVSVLPGEEDGPATVDAPSADVGDDAGDVFDLAADDDVSDDTAVDLPFTEVVPGDDDDETAALSADDEPFTRAGEPAPVDDPAALVDDPAGPAVDPAVAEGSAVAESAEVPLFEAAAKPKKERVRRAKPNPGIPAQGRGGAEAGQSTEEEAPESPPMDEGELRAALEAILLVVDEPVAEMQLAQIMEQPTERVAATLEDISARYTAAGHGFDLRRAAGGWRLYTRPEYAPYVERFVLDGQSVRLTQAALETLAVVAYKQPVTRSRISAIRGVNCDGVMRTLVTRGLIEECGTEGETGAFLYRTTPLFLEKLGLNSVDQLPPLAPFLPDDVEEVLDASG